METITNVSELEAEIVEVIPEVVIPAKEVRKTVTIKALKAEIAELESAKKRLDMDIKGYEAVIAETQAELNSIQNKKKGMDAQISALLEKIDALVSVGVVEKLPEPEVPDEKVLPE